jgi:hypothetical protein
MASSCIDRLQACAQAAIKPQITQQMRRFTAIACLCFSHLQAHDLITTKITWSREISRLVLEKCNSCHRPGGSAFSFATYQDVRPWAAAIKEEVLERRMPPFAAVKGFADLRDDQSLMQTQMELISAWVEGGAPEGNPALLPKSVNPRSILASKPRSGPPVVVEGALRLSGAMTFVGIEPTSLVEGSSVRVIAQGPDGRVTPLLWLYEYRHKYSQSYYFRQPLTLLPGTRIIVYPQKAGALALLPAISHAEPISSGLFSPKLQ